MTDARLPEDLYYSPDHIWIKPDGDSFVAGITDYAQSRLGEIAYIDLPRTGDSLNAGEDFGEIESLKTVSSLKMPLAGKIVEANPLLANDPGAVNRDCYDEGWLIRIEPDAPGSIDSLLDAAGYRAALE